MKILEHNVETGEVTERDATLEEMAQAELDAVTAAEENATKEAKAASKAALLDRLGITAEEAQLLLA